MMSLSPGTRLGSFEIAGLLGVGGMGEVYRARDTKLGREVAIKVLPEAVASDAERLARFEREAKLLASLDHPNIGALYEFRQAVPMAGESLEKGDSPVSASPRLGQSPFSGEVHFLVMQLVEGETLAERIGRKPLSVREALPVFAQIARALEAAHERDIIHRDLKPANIKVSRAGDVKVLDFGMAKTEAAGRRSSPTATTMLTNEAPAQLTTDGAILGTPSYMSPEQARGLDVDKRADVWAFGCCMFEALTGKVPFKGATISDTLVAVLEREPDWNALPDDLPPHLRSMLRRCLDKDANRRLRDMRDIAFALEDAAIELRHGSPSTKSTAAVPAVDAEPIRSLAVLPFDNLMGDPEQEYFVDGMTDLLSAELSKIKALKVISRGSAMLYKRSEKPLPTIAAELGVEGLVEGSILRSGNDVRITAQLIHGKTDEHVWANTYDGALENMLKLQGEVALDIARAIHVTVTPAEERRIESVKKIKLAAEEELFRANHYFALMTPQNFEKAAEHCRRAIELDPGNARAYALLSFAQWVPASFGWGLLREALNKARPAAEKALELDDELADAHVIRGWFTMYDEWDWEGSRRHFQRALELDPNSAMAHQGMAFYLGKMARFDEAVESSRTSVRLNPKSFIFRGTYGGMLLDARRFDEAVRQSGSDVADFPTIAVGYAFHADNLMCAGRFDEAIALLEDALAKFGRLPNLLGSLAAARGARGEPEAARALVEELQNVASRTFVLNEYFARGYAAAGDLDNAFRWLSKAVDEAETRASWISSPFWDPLRADPRFVEIAKRVRLPDHVPLRKLPPSALTPTASAEPADRSYGSLVVLPFDNLMGDPEQEYFVDGMTDSLSAELSKIKALKVISRTSAMRYKGTDKPLRDIARELGVDVVVEGSIFRADHEVRITAQLIDARADEHIWGENYTGELKNILTLQGEVALAIAREINVTVTADEVDRIEQTHPVNEDAYESLLQGRHCFYQFTGPGFARAVEHFEDALSIDPDFAAAHAFLSLARWMPITLGLVNPREAIEMGAAVAKRAVALDPSLAAAHLAAGYLAMAGERDWEGAREAFERCLELNPNLWEAQFALGIYYHAMTRHDDAVRQFDLALSVNPNSNIIGVMRWMSVASAGRFDEAAKGLRDIIARAPEFFLAKLNFGYAMIASGRPEEAIELLESTLPETGDLPYAKGLLAWAYAGAGQDRRAKRLLRELESADDGHYVPPTTFAGIYAALGETDRAFEWLDRAVNENDWYTLWLGSAWAYERLAADPRYDRLLARMKFSTTIREKVSEKGRAWALDHAQEVKAPEKPGSRARPSKWLNVPVVASAAVVLIAIAFVFGRATGPPVAQNAGGAVPEAAAPEIRSLAVLPFDNLMGDAEQEYFVDGMTDALSAELSKIRSLKVISRTSAMQYKGTDKTIPEIARELGVDALVEGSIFRGGDEVRITAQLIDGTTNAHVWAENYEGGLAGILALQREVALDIAREIRVALSAEVEQRLGTAVAAVNPAAHDAYLRGRYFWNQRTVEGFQKALEFFEEAKSIDPEFAPAYAGAADCYTVTSAWGMAPSPNALRRAQAEVRRALELDPSLAEAIATSGVVTLGVDRDWEGAERKFRRAIELDPNYAYAHSLLASMMIMERRFEECFQESARARELDPLSLFVQTNEGRMKFLAGQTDEAIRMLEATLRVNPTFPPAQTSLATALAAAEKPDELERVIEGARTSGIETRHFEARLQFLRGNRAEAVSALERLAAVRSDAFIPASYIAVAYVQLGDLDTAFRWAETAREEHDAFLPWWWVDPEVEPLRRDPRFLPIARELGFDRFNTWVEPVAADARRIEKIAVLPLANFSGDPEQAYFVDGMTETLITELAQVKSLHVISRTSSMQYKNVIRPMEEIARELGVDAVVEGSVYRVGEQVRINAQLIDGATGSHLWAERYDGTLENALKIQAEVALAVAHEIDAVVTPAELSRLASGGAINPKAHEAYLRGRYWLAKRTPEGFENASRYFQDAQRLDPDSALPHAGLAETYDLIGSWRLRPAKETFALARREAEQALAIDESVGEAYNSLAWVYFWDALGDGSAWARADAAFRRAIELTPSFATAHQWYAEVLACMGRFDESIAHSKQALELDPLSLIVNGSLAFNLYLARDYDAAIVQLNKTLELDPEFPPALEWLMLTQLASGNANEAVRAAERLAAVSPDTVRGRLNVAITQAAAGNRTRALEFIAADENEPTHEFRRFEMMMLNAYLGEPERAMKVVDEMFNARDSELLWAAVAPHFDLLRDEPEFQAFLRRMEFPN